MSMNTKSLLSSKVAQALACEVPASLADNEPTGAVS